MLRTPTSVLQTLNQMLVRIEVAFPELATGIPNSVHPYLNPPSGPTPNLLLFSPSLVREV